MNFSTSNIVNLDENIQNIINFINSNVKIHNEKIIALSKEIKWDDINKIIFKFLHDDDSGEIKRWNIILTYMINYCLYQSSDSNKKLNSVNLLVNIDTYNFFRMFVNITTGYKSFFSGEIFNSNVHYILTALFKIDEVQTIQYLEKNIPLIKDEQVKEYISNILSEFKKLEQIKKRPDLYIDTAKSIDINIYNSSISPASVIISKPQKTNNIIKNLSSPSNQSNFFSTFRYNNGNSNRKNPPIFNTYTTTEKSSSPLAKKYEFTNYCPIVTTMPSSNLSANKNNSPATEQFKGRLNITNVDSLGINDSLSAKPPTNLYTQTVRPFKPVLSSRSELHKKLNEEAKGGNYR